MKIKMKISSLLLLSLLACNANNTNPPVAAPAPVIAKPSPVNQYDDYANDLEYAVHNLGILFDNQCLTLDTEGKLRSMFAESDYSYFQYLPNPEATKIMCYVLSFSFDMDRFHRGSNQPKNATIEMKASIKEKAQSALQEKERMIKEQKEKSRRSKQKKMK